LEALNEAYSIPETKEEREARNAAVEHYKRFVLEKEEW
jgi:hypothetical protein